MKTLTTAALLLAATTGAFATEYSNFEIPAGMLTRAEVRAQLGTAAADGAISVGDATQFVLPAAGAPATSRYAAVPRSERINTRNASFQSAELPGRI